MLTRLSCWKALFAAVTRCVISASKVQSEVKTLIGVLRQNSILIKLPKCSWGQTELPYLGHIVSKDGIKADPKKIEAVACWPEPTNLNEIQQFLGLTNFFHKYIQGYTILTLPLTVLLNNTPFDWNTACENAFAGLKTAFTSAPCLAVPDTSEGSPTFDWVCVMLLGLVLVLCSSNKVGFIAFWSRKMVPAEQNCHITEQELLAVIEALKAFRCC